MLDRSLNQIANIDHDLAQQVAAFGWVTDGVTGEEWIPLAVIRDIAKVDVEMAKLTSLQPWLADGITKYELIGLDRLNRIAQHDLEFAKLILDQSFMDLPFRQRDASALDGLFQLLTGRGRNVMAMVASQPWFEDGLDDLEAVLLQVLREVNDDLLHALAKTHYIASLPIKLPATGDITLVVVRHTPFPGDDETFAAMEEGARAIDAFTQTPFEVNDLVLLVNEPGIWQRASGSVVGGWEPGYDDRQIIVHNPAVFGWSSDKYKGIIYHELGHLYMLAGPRWLVEGAAEFFRAYIRDKTGAESIHQRLVHLHSYEASPSELPGVGCGKKNLQQHLDDWRPNNCDYYLGEVFLLGMYTAIGAEGASEALRDLQMQTTTYRSGAHEDLIYQVFEKNTPSGKEDAFKAAYQRYHGGPINTLPPPTQNQRASLVALYNSTLGANWKKNANWLTDMSLGTWYGVITGVGELVTGLAIHNNDLAGGLPSELGNLTNLKELNLSLNDLTGEIPSELGGLVNLKELDLSGNDLTGEIPHDLAGLTNLEGLDLSDNQLSGEISPELARLPNLQRLYLFNNQLSGRIPAQLAKLPNLLGLHLRDNRLSGEIPSELGNLTKLRRLQLSGNQLSGQIPPELGNLTNLTVALDLSRNQLSGRIPLELSRLTSVSRFDLSENRLEGEISSELGGLANVRGLDLSGNHLSGEIPKPLGSLSELSELDLSGNQLGGNIPKELGSLSKLWTLDLSDNHLSGEIPSELGHFKHLHVLDLSNNQLTDKIPPELGSLPNLKELLLGGNRLTGCIPIELRNVPTNDFEELSMPFCDVASAGKGS